MVDQTQLNFTAQCPYCGDTVTLNIRDKPIAEADTRWFFLADCPNARRFHRCKPIFAVYDSLNHRILRLYPSAADEGRGYHDSIPLSIRDDVAEATRAESAECFRASATMLRRALEGVAVDQLGEDAKDKNGWTKRLNVLIDLLASRSLITKSLQVSAQEIRYLGNYGAHPIEDGLDDIRREDVRAVRELAGQILQSIYIGPAKAKALKERRTKGP